MPAQAARAGCGLKAATGRACGRRVRTRERGWEAGEMGRGDRGPVVFGEGREEERMAKMQGGGARSGSREPRQCTKTGDRASYLAISVAGRLTLLKRGEERSPAGARGRARCIASRPGAPPTTGVAVSQIGYLPIVSGWHPISRSASRMAWCVRARGSGSRTPSSPCYCTGSPQRASQDCVRGVCQDVAWTTTSWSLLGPAGRIADSHAADA
ncbi:hypothetical protein B0H10DRAFT_1975684 [Mycena sp. CBHHK59/15]|nr:hypothetical protein B0H10DRAFT_1975684 [Mycena sp. CBHHK59/15]